jgi:hypothetical protein
MTMQLIETKTLGTAAASIEFTSIPQDFTDLVVLLSGRLTGGTTFGVSVFFNGSTSGFSHRKLFGRGDSVSSNTADQPIILNGSAFTANTFGNVMVYIPNYTGSTQKSFSIDSVSENNATLAYQTIAAGLWTGTSAITSLQLTSSDSTLTADSTVSLYGILKGSDGIVTTS